MPRVPEEIHVQVQLLDEGQVEAVRKIRRLLSDLSDALSVFVQGDPDTGQPDMETRLASGQLLDIEEHIRFRLSDPDADKTDPDNLHPVLRAKSDSGQTAGQVVREDDIRGICGQELRRPWVQGVRWCPRPPGHEEDCGPYGPIPM